MTAPAPLPDTRNAYDEHEPQPTPDQAPGAELVAAIAALLVVGAAVGMTARAIRALFARSHIPVSLEVITVVLELTGRRKPRPRTIGRSDVARAQANLEAQYRAAYVLNASRRIQDAVNGAVRDAERALPHDATPAQADRVRRDAADAALRAAAGRERSYELAHERAARARLEAAVDVAEAADQWGVLLGWHAHDDDRTTPECRDAHGSNFSPVVPPLIGFPGTLHGGTCRCRPGPPFPGARSTDEALGFWTRRRA